MSKSDVWTLVNGAWGDFFACYGNICKLLQERNLEKTNVVYYGLDSDILRCIKIQDNVNKVINLEISDPDLYFKYAGLAASDFLAWTQVTGLDKKIPNLIPTHISRYYNIENPTECNRSFFLKLPVDKQKWEPFSVLYQPYIVVQPFSCHSCRFDKHWPYWVELIYWLLDNCDKRIVLIGQLTSKQDHRFKFPWIEHPNLINLVDQTESMLDVFEIVENSEYTITTSNSLSMYSIIKQKSALVICNQIIKQNAFYYYNWIHHKPNTVLDYTVSLAEFKDHFKFFDAVAAKPK